MLNIFLKWNAKYWEKEYMMDQIIEKKSFKKCIYLWGLDYFNNKINNVSLVQWLE